ncbi:uncharacterized protein [Nicotiana tomentosiformis]|uniref:uncharacterized protein n=1 Tax=Nicotiana tomentosiformis TaxID=4098 RepID=UPI00388C3B6B
MKKELEELEEVAPTDEEQELVTQDGGIDQLEPSQCMERMKISIHALNSSLGYRTLKVTGYHAKKALSILIDTGSSNNFIEPELVRHLGCTVKSTRPQLVAAANENLMVDKVCIITWLLQAAEFSAEYLLLPLGSCGVVLGVQWLLTLGDIKMNFRKLTMEFWYKGRKHLFRGAGSQVKVQETKKLVKHAGDLSQLCMIKVVPMGSAEEQCSTIEDHLIHLRSVFVEMSKHQFFAKKNKCFFGVQRIEYLRYFITAERVSTDPQKIEVVQNWPTSTTLKQLRGFLGLAGYYRRFIKEYKKGVENKVADALSRVAGAELLTLMVFPGDTDLFQAIIDSWNSDQELKHLIEELQADPHTHKHFTYFQSQLRRNGKLVIGKQELFSLQGVQLNTSSAYHPQSDRHTQVLNRSLETYLRCYCNEDAAKWYSCLPMAEYWYNTSFHSAIKTTPYEALYGRPPPLHLPYLPGESTSAEVDNTLLNRELKL